MNRIIKTVISAILVFSILTVSAAAKDTMFGPREDWLITEEYIDDVLKYDFESVVSELGKNEELSQEVQDVIFLGLMDYEESGFFEFNKEVTEKELAEIIIKLRYNNDSALLDYQKNYGSDKNATIKTVIAMMVDALGYADEAKFYGDDGYYVMANKLKLFKNLEYNSMSDNVTKLQLATILYNSLDKDLKMEVYNDHGYLSFEVAEGKNFLSETFKMVKIDGFFNGKKGVNIYSAEKIRDGYIQIDRLNYKYEDENILSLFGKRVEGYARYDENAKRYDIALLREKDSKHTAKTYNLKDGYIDLYDVVFEDESGNEESYTITNLEYVVYNGDYVALNDVNNYFDGRNALITFSSSNDDGNYNVAIIKEFESYPVRNSSVADNRIVFDNSLTYNSLSYLQLDPQKVIHIYDDNLNPFSISDFTGDEVISFYQNSDYTYTEIVVSLKQIEGTVAGTLGTEIVLDNGESYIVADTYNQAVSNNKARNLELGLEGKFYISYDGTIVDYQADNELKWGFLKACGYTSEGSTFDDKNYGLKLFTSDGKWITVVLADKIKMDGKSGVKKEDVDGIITANSAEGTVIRYNINNEGKVNFLDTIVDTAEESTDNERVVKKWSLVNASANWSKGMSWKTCPGKITNSTIIFNIPADPSKEYLYTVTTNNIIVEGGKYNIDFYSPDNFLCCEAAVVVADVGSQTLTYQGSHFLGVESVKQVFDEESNEILYKVTGWIWGRNHTEGEWGLTENFMEYNAQMPKVGGVYRYILSGSNIQNLDLLVDDGILPDDFSVNTGIGYERMVGTVVDVTNGFIKVNVNGTEWVHTTHEGKYMSYSKSKKKFTKISYSDIYPGERIYIYGAVENAGGMLVVRN